MKRKLSTHFFGYIFGLFIVFLVAFILKKLVIDTMVGIIIQPVLQL
ncbi:hypothetical protein ACTPEO_15415 [Clostridioides difficile]